MLIKLGRILDILLAFLIKQLFLSRFYLFIFLTVGYKMISIANSALRASIHKSSSDFKLGRRKPKEDDSKRLSYSK